MKSILLLFYFTAILLSGCSPAANLEAADASAPAGAPTFDRPSASAEILQRPLTNTDDQHISYCEILDDQTPSYSGFRDTQLEPLASLSKVTTSAWALESLGADFRFESTFFLKAVPGQEGVFDAYLRTNYDPVIDYKKLLYFLSELNQSGVRRLRKLVIDETTRVFLSVLSNPHVELDQVPISSEKSIENLKLIFNSRNWSDKTRAAQNQLQAWAQRQGKKLRLPDEFSVDSVTYQPAHAIRVVDYDTKKVIRSAPLFKYLKNMNVYSNNYLADALFNRLGGVAGFKVFQKNSLKIAEKELIVYTGSGLPMSLSGRRYDNFGSCFSMLKILSFFRQKADGQGLNLGHVLLNPSLDQDGTFDQDRSYNQAVVLKTGRLYDVPAMNLAGFVSTEKGVLSFVFLGHDFGSHQAEQIEKSRTQMLKDISTHYKTRPTFLTLDETENFL